MGNGTQPQECRVDITPFDCARRTCECDSPNSSETVSENYLVRFERRDHGGRPDKQRIIFECSADCEGILSVERGGDEISEVSIECTSVPQCLVAIDASSISDPPIEMEDGTGSMTLHEAWMEFQRWGAPSDPIPEIQPFTKREKFTVTVECCRDPGCQDSIEVIGWNCDLIILAYQMTYMAAMSTWGITTGVQSVQQFFASMAIRGADALCKLYFSSATSCTREIKDLNATIALSAVLAEETLKAAVANLRGEPMTSNWEAYFDEPNLTMAQLDLTAFQHYADLFADAHLKDGLIKAMDATGSSPCREEDLDTVVDTLTDAQAPTLLKAVGAIPASMAGTSVEERFQDSMRTKMLEALREVGETTAASNLQQKWSTS